MGKAYVPFLPEAKLSVVFTFPFVSPPRRQTACLVISLKTYAG
jgi:hypothetical protein